MQGGVDGGPDTAYSIDFEDDVVTKTRVCGGDGKAYWLATAKGTDSPGGDYADWVMLQIESGVPDKTEALDGTQYGMS